MARIFTTSFMVNHQSYAAVVSVCFPADMVQVTIELLDEDLRKCFTKGRIRYSGPDGFNQLQGMHAFADTVIRNAGRAVQEQIEETLLVK